MELHRPREKTKRQFTLKQMWSETAKKIDSLHKTLETAGKGMSKAAIIDKAVSQFANRKLKQIKEKSK